MPEAVPDLASSLSDTQRRIMPYLVSRQTNADIAMALGISPATVKWNVSRILERLEVPNRRRAAEWWSTVHRVTFERVTTEAVGTPRAVLSTKSYARPVVAGRTPTGATGPTEPSTNATTPNSSSRPPASRQGLDQASPRHRWARIGLPSRTLPAVSAPLTIDNGTAGGTIRPWPNRTSPSPGGGLPSASRKRACAMRAPCWKGWAGRRPANVAAIAFTQGSASGPSSCPSVTNCG